MIAPARVCLDTIRAARPQRGTRGAAVLGLALLTTLVLGVTLAGAVAPTVTIEPATPAYITAKVKGTVNPEGQPTTYAFQYITDAAFQAHADAHQTLTVSATGGTFTLAFKAQTTGALPFNASASELETALNALASIGGAGGSVTVTGGPGDETGSTPYAIVFAGSLAETNVETISSDPSALSGGNASANVETTVPGRAPGFEGAANGPEGSNLEGTTAQEVAGELTGLAPATTYHLRLFAENGEPAEALAPTFTTEAVAKPIVSIDPVITFTGTTAHFSGHITPGGTDPAFATSYYFECSPGCPGQPGPLPTEPTDANSREVTEDVHGLEPNTEYTVSLHASNAGGEEVKTAAVFKTLAVTPEAWAGTNTPESDSTVLLRGAVNGRNSQLTDCHFAYGPTTAYGHTAPCESTPWYGTSVLLTAKLTGLAPGSVGHFKVIATSAAGPGESLDEPFATFSAPEAEATCPNQARREEQGAAALRLPECRAWEMVSPPQKNGGNVLTYASQTRAAANGEAAQFTSLQAFGDAQGTGVPTPYIATRDSTAGTQGWSTHGILPQLEPNSFRQAARGFDTTYQAEFSPDLNKGVLTTHTPLTDEPETDKVQNLYLREGLLSPGADSSHLLSPCPVCVQTAEPLSDPSSNYQPQVADGTSDLGQILFEAKRNLTADAPAYPPFPSSFCHANTEFPAFSFLTCAPRLYESDHGTLRLVGRIPPAGQSECDDTGATPCEAAPISFAGLGAGAPSSRYTINTLSEDGSKAFFTVPSTENEVGGNLYMRLNHTTTVQLNVSERTDCADHDPCTGTPEPDPGGHQPASYKSASADGSKIFFSTEEQLLDSPGSDLYVYDTTLPASDPDHLRHVFSDQQPDDGATGDGGILGTSSDGSYLYFLDQSALLAGQPDLPVDANKGLYVWHEGTISFIGSVGDGGTNTVGNHWTSGLDSRVSPDGRTLLFSSESGIGLTGYDHTTGSPNCGRQGNVPCKELYLYKADTNSLRCVSCNPTGAPATADAGVNAQQGTGGALPSSHLGHALSADGSHVFFDTGERLVPEDTNGTTSDVYSYDTADGSLHLLSSGTGSDGSHFLDASLDGSDVFFSTNQALLGWDGDANGDLYDARVGGGFPEPAPVLAACQLDTCRTLTGAPAPPAAATQSFSGSANPKPPRKHKKHHKKQSQKKHHHKRAGNKQGGAK